MTMLWIAGHLDVRATREELPALDLSLPDQIDPARATSPEPRSLKCDPIVLRDRNGATEILNWWDSSADFPRFSPRDSVEVWVIEQKDLDEAPGLSKAIRFYLYKLARVKSNIKSRKEDQKIRHEALEDIETDLELRSAIARHILQVDEKDVLLPRNILPLLGDQIDSRTLHNDLADIRRQVEDSETDSTQSRHNSRDTAEMNGTGIGEQSFEGKNTEESDDQASPASGQEGKAVGVKKELDSSAEKECLEQEPPTTPRVDPEGSQTQTVTHQTIPASPTTLDHRNPAQTSPQRDPDDKPVAIDDKHTEIQHGSDPHIPEELQDASHSHVLAEASRLYERLQEFDPELPNFDFIMEILQADETVDGDKKIGTFLTVITTRADEINNAPKRPAANIKKYLDGLLKKHGK
ncbi:hypothetical protein P8631_11795 [Guyparkeria sp. 1SP6A2]|nr:hypothetical protein [Guyparkeria sp. 1SP6A2]